jgi:hypothetical protein
MARKYVTCPQGHLNDRTGGRRKCSFPGCGATLPKRRVPKHAETLRDDSYAKYVQVNEQIHGAGEDCGVCGKPPKFERRHDRDHDHVTGAPRGLACPGNQGCNALMPRWLTADRAQAIADYLRRVESFYTVTVDG